jgi:DNA-binding LacI/PurR family transcriptional regulator
MSGRRTAARPVTLKDLATAAGVSVATASQALSGRGRMTTDTRRRVERLAAELGYVANPLAQGLRTGRTHAIGLHHQRAAQSLNMPYFREFLAGAIQAAHRHDYDLAVLSSNPSAPRPTSPRVDGVIVVDPIGDDLRARELMESHLPVVAGEHVPAEMPPCAVVAADHAGAVRQILDEAARRGARSPLLVAPDRHSGWGEELRRVYRAWCVEHGLEPRDVETRFGEQSAEANERVIAPALLPDVDLVVTAGAPTTHAALAALCRTGREPGRDVLIASAADDTSLGDGPLPVTAVELPAKDLGAACVERLVWLLDEAPALDAAHGTVRTVPASVRFRASTAALLRGDGATD